jgi:hypothetical protein
VRKNAFQKDSGTHAASAPAMSNPRTMSRMTEAQSITNRWLIAVKPLAEKIFCPSVPALTDMSISAWPSM